MLHKITSELTWPVATGPSAPSARSSATPAAFPLSFLLSVLLVLLTLRGCAILPETFLFPNSLPRGLQGIERNVNSQQTKTYITNNWTASLGITNYLMIQYCTVTIPSAFTI